MRRLGFYSCTHILTLAHRAVPNASNALRASRQYATTPHIAGSEEDFRTATDFLAHLQTSLGIVPPPELPVFPAGSDASRRATLDIANLTGPAAWIDVYYPVQNLPTGHSLEILDDDGHAVWTAELEEEADTTDPEAGEHRLDVPVFHGFSKDGEATGRLIHVGYGRKSDYDELVAKGACLLLLRSCAYNDIGTRRRQL